MRTFDVIVAATASTFGIGRRGRLPWKIGVDMAFFKRATLTCDMDGMMNAVIMGRKTYQSIPARFRPLQGRVNVVISRNPNLRQELELPDDVLVAGSLSDALAMIGEGTLNDRVSEVFVIGGGSIYEEAVKSQLCSRVVMTTVHSTGFEDCDVSFPSLPSDEYILTSASAPVTTSEELVVNFNVFERIKKKTKEDEQEAESVIADDAVQTTTTTRTSDDELNALLKTSQAPMTSQLLPPSSASTLVESMAAHEEMQYLNLIRDIIDHGVQRGDRTGTGTLSKFGVQMRFSLRNNVLPLLTTKRVFWRGVAEELLWFVSGSTNAKDLQDKNIRIWDGNGSREFLDSRGLGHREEGDLGPVYGFQWRHFGAQYTDMHADYSGQGVDQLAKAIDAIKNNPTDRRILVSAWNPAALDEMALPPCHMFCQFYVADGALSCQMYQRSADMGLGVPFNIASYALLTRLVARVCDLDAGEFIHTIGDAHVYLNHVDALRTQLTRIPRPFPRLVINEEKRDIDSFSYEDLTVEGYSPHGTIKMKMAV
uniref:Bifunctional dihydrofolate reductase-thymidylate synthase n=1 Tax=Octactis speculum TaxID=3111310 RepID=A0A7S2MDM9_9STRA